MIFDSNSLIGCSTLVDACCKTSLKSITFGTDEYPSMYSKLNTGPLLPRITARWLLKLRELILTQMRLTIGVEGEMPAPKMCQSFTAIEGRRRI